MARLWSCGFELNSAANGVEYDTNGGATSTIVSTTVHGGTYANQINLTISAVTNTHQFASSNINQIYARIYFNFVSFPTTTHNIMRLSDTTTAVICAINMSSAGVASLIDKLGNVIGSASAITTGSWHYLELFMNATPASGSRVITGRLDGTQFATSSNRTSTQLAAAAAVNWGFMAGNATTKFFVDDIAINDNSGSFQNTWPGAGQIIHLRPDSAGDSTQWTPDTGSNFARVNEIIPDDATSFVSDALISNIDLYNCAASGIGASDTVNVVSIGGRFNNPTADATTNFKFEVEKTSGGTLSQSSSITPNSTTWKTNAIATPFVYPLTTYQDPDSSAWTQVTLDTMQIGVITGTIGVFGVQLSTIWALVDYTPNASPPPSTINFITYRPPWTS